ncbi:MAG: 30S ribosomal protein S12 methylthiotransferase RimO [Armatimonadia bacterium]|nr:30S ribosomal protein S12 methylthiotransferase RimO [Armatimonadia bacterium]
MARIALISLGCPKNLVDSEVMLGLLQDAGHEVIDQVEGADVVIVNTCAFIEPAVEEAVEALLDTVALRGEDGRPRVICAGCLTERYGSELQAELPEIDAFVGPGSVNEIADVVERCVDEGQLLVQAAPPWLYSAETPRTRTGREWLAYVKVADGCDHQCAYCMIPRLRGSFRSRSPEDIRREVDGLIAEGVREICMIAQDTSMWGADLAGDWTLARLLRTLELDEWDGWVRLQYLHPDGITPELLRAVADVEQVVPYFDIPLQHAAPAVLRSMGRRGDAESYLAIVEGVRETLPRAAIRTTFIVGYPGETEADFGALLEFVERARFDRLSAFRYWDEPGTRAAELPDHVSEGDALDRLETLMLTQAEISREINQSFIGERLRVLVERDDDETGETLGRSFRDAPDVDGEVVLEGQAPLGTFADVTITYAEEHDLWGETDGS